MRRKQSKVPGKVQEQALKLIWEILRNDAIPGAKKKLKNHYGSSIYVEIDYLKKKNMGFNRLHRLLDVAGLKPELRFKYDDYEFEGV